MNLTRGVAAKIFGLAVFLLALTIVVAVYLLIQVAAITKQTVSLAERDVPLGNAVAKLQESALRRRLAFERWFGALGSKAPDPEVLAESSRNYQVFTEQLKADFTQVENLLNSYPPNHAGLAEIAKARQIVSWLKNAYPPLDKRQQEVLQAAKAGDHELAKRLVSFLNDRQRQIQDERATLLKDIGAITVRASEEISRRQRLTVWLTIAATVSSVLLGLAVAAMVTFRLTRPVRSLISAIQDVREGKLDVQVEIANQDEIGELAESVNYFVRELKDKEHIKRTFGRYIDPRVLERVLAQSGSALVSGERRRMTVAFGDLKGFTSLSERLTPSAMVKLLNRHFTLQAEVVQAHEGVVDKFIGDAILALWGPPFVSEDQQVPLALSAMLAQAAAMEVLRQELPEITGLRRDVPELTLCVGVCTGEVIVGNIGSENACSYTVIGDAVNVASRIEGGNRTYGTQLLVDEHTASQARSEYELREIDSVAFKGKDEPIRIFEVLGRKGATPASRLQLRDTYERALQAYRKADWREADALFSESLTQDPGDRASLVMRSRLDALREGKNQETWNGVWRL